MVKIGTALLALVLLCTMSSFAQQWQFAGAFPDTSFHSGSGGHGAAVDPAGKVWLQLYAVKPGDSIFDGTKNRAVKPIYVFNANGTPASFSPIKIVVGPTFRDTLFSTNSNRGLRADISGNILASVFDACYRINYQTGAGMNKVGSGAGNSIGAVGVDTLGEIFIGTVVPGNPIKIYDSNFGSLGNVTDTSVGFHRSFQVSKDGNDVYWAGYTNHAIYRYHSANGSFGPYAVGPNDTLLKGFDCESMDWNPTRTRLWLSSGSANDAPNRYPGVTTHYRLNTWYAYNPVNATITDSIKWDWRYSSDSVNVRPRAIAFSPDGKTAYVGCFGGDYPAFEKFNLITGVKPDPDVVPNSFTLSQNYPNPFNPSTDIKFTLTHAGLTKLVVFDMLGRVLATLVNEQLTAGAYKIRFDASSLSSGSYIYTLTSGGTSISKKMLLLK
jgi:hypothetical protein